MADQRSSADLASLRQLPLPNLVRQLGYGQDPHDRRRWKRPGSILSLNGQRFYDHLAGQGGGGAIDLVKHARHGSFREACQFLETFVRRPSLSSPTPPTLSLPEDCPANWPLVRQRLAADRCLSPRLLQSCRERRLIRADRRVNAVFPCTDAQRRVTGAEITGTLVRPDSSRFRMMAARSRKSAGSFWLPVSLAPPQTVILTESAIDALSAWSLPWLHRPHTVFLSTAGVATRLPDWLHGWKLQQIFGAFDADEPGDHSAAKLIANHPRVIRLRPQGGKDWNDLLKHHAAKNQASPFLKP